MAERDETPAMLHVGSLDARDVAVNLSGRSFGWSCNCGGNSLALLKGTKADYTVRCGCGAVYRARLEKVADI